MFQQGYFMHREDFWSSSCATLWNILCEPFVSVILDKIMPILLHFSFRGGILVCSGHISLSGNTNGGIFFIYLALSLKENRNYKLEGFNYRII